MPGLRKNFGWMLGCLVLTLAAPAQEEPDVGPLLDAAQDWAEENLDESVLRALPEVDRERVEAFLRELQVQLQGGRVLDLVALKDTADLVLPVLEAQPETRPYAAWLRARLDYFVVAEKLREKSAPARPIPGQPPVTPPNPSPVNERRAWDQQLSRRERPAAADALVPRLKSIFAAERVPEELVWLAEVESGFNPGARSPAGAAGLFQLMPGTAKELGLRRWPFDQRYQIEPSARAAARHLKRLQTQFGDWSLALAAYNAGGGKVQSLLKQRRTRSFDGIATALPAETQLFVPKVAALVHAREGVPLKELRSPKP